MVIAKATLRNKNYEIDLTNALNHPLFFSSYFFAIVQLSSHRAYTHIRIHTHTHILTQVWFQNARAKWRRNVMRQDGTQSTNSTSNGLTQLTSMGGGPPSVQSSTSSNIDTSGMTPSHALEEMHHMTFAELYWFYMSRAYYNSTNRP